LDLNDVLLEAHVKHLVSLVQDLELAIIQSQFVILQKINQSAWGTHQHIRSHPLDVTHLLTARGPTSVNKDRFQVSVPFYLCLYLRSKFSSWLQDDGLDLVIFRICLFGVSDKLLQRKQEREGFASSGSRSINVKMAFLTLLQFHFLQ